MKHSSIGGMIIRYLVLLVLPIYNMYLFYPILTPLTAYLTYVIINLFYGADLINNTIIIQGKLLIELIPACIAGAAYYLLIILNLTTPMPGRSRLKSILFLVFSFLALNIVRITLFSILAINDYEYFSIAHIASWYIGSTLLVTLIWFSNIHLFKIKNIPVYTDIKTLLNIISKGKKK